MREKIESIKDSALKEIKDVASFDQLEELRIKYLGRKSEFNQILKGLKDLSAEEKKTIGQFANEVKAKLQEELDRIEKELKEKSFDAEAEKIDVTIPAEKKKSGNLHPITQIRNEIVDIFTSMGFEIASGPEVETEWHNFDALNIPEDHPSRDEWDTFWLKEKKGKEGKFLLRTHTSPVQIRYMEKNKPPLRIIAPGKCFRNEATDSRHEHTFYQFEALVVDKDINVGNFKFIAEEFFSKFFKKEIAVRLRPSYFPFTEPSFEFDISCSVCLGKGCSVCSSSGWLEVGGAGMVNQAVFEAAGYKKGEYQGFAWGFGLERLLMMRDKIEDIRLFHSGDLRFISQF